MNQISVDVRPTLDKVERNTTTWLKVYGYLTQRLVSLRARNDGDMTERETAMLRGQIAEIKALLAMGDDVPDVL